MIKGSTFLRMLLLALLPVTAFAADPAMPPASDEVPAQVKGVLSALHPQQGRVDLANGAVTLTVPQGLGYLPPDQTTILLRQLMHYSSRINSLGSIIPTTVPIGSPASWDALITYRNEGHVSDDKVASMDTDALMKQITKENEQYNASLKQKGYTDLGANILGWAEKPVYDPAAHTLYWALETQPVSSKNHMITFHIVLFGRHGMLSFVIVGSLEQLPMFEDATKKLLPAMQFNAPERYADFDPKTDKPSHFEVKDIISGHNSAAESKTERTAIEFMAIVRWVLLLGIIVYLFKALRRRKSNASTADNEESQEN